MPKIIEKKFTQRIQNLGLYSEGWTLLVPANLTCKFLTYLRPKKITFSIDVAGLTGGLDAEMDVFILEKIDAEEIKKIISDFKNGEE